MGGESEREKLEEYECRIDIRFKLVPSHDLAALFDLSIRQTLLDISLEPIFGSRMNAAAGSPADKRSSVKQGNGRISIQCCRCIRV